jgi:hypothetical protein
MVEDNKRAKIILGAITKIQCLIGVREEGSNLASFCGWFLQTLNLDKNHSAEGYSTHDYCAISRDATQKTDSLLFILFLRQNFILSSINRSGLRKVLKISCNGDMVE